MGMPHHVVIVEDDTTALENYCNALASHGYAVHGYPDRATAIRAIQSDAPDLAILDIQLGNEYDGGFDVLRFLQQHAPQTIPLFVSARDNDFDRISGLRMGAWDYLPKPVSLSILKERVASLIRIRELRNQTQPTHTLPPEQGLSVDLERVRAYWNGQELEVTLTELRILDCLASQPGKVCSFDQLAEVTRQRIVTQNTISGHIRRIRGKLKAMDPAFRAIRNVHGVGYRWEV
jgi:two-component system OmpR family response regulator